jgi:hypothetical protein
MHSSLREHALGLRYQKQHDPRNRGIPEPPAHYGRDMRTTIEPNELRDLLHDRGLRARLYVDEDDESPNAFIESGSSGLAWIALLLSTEGHVTLTFELYGILANAFDDPLRFCNRYNQADVLCGAPAFVTTDDDGDEVIKIRKIIDLKGGVADKWLNHQLVLWDHAVNLFSIEYRRELSENPQNLSESDPDDEESDYSSVDPLKQLIDRVEAGEDPIELIDGIVSELDAQGQRAQSLIDRLKSTDWNAVARDTYPFHNK